MATVSQEQRGNKNKIQKLTEEEENLSTIGNLKSCQMNINKQIFPRSKRNKDLLEEQNNQCNKKNLRILMDSQAGHSYLQMLK